MFVFFCFTLLSDVSRIAPATHERIRFVVRYAYFTVGVSAVTLVMSLLFLIVELSVFQFNNWTSWLVEQTLMRALEAVYALGTLYALRRIPPHEVKPERRSLLFFESPRVIARECVGNGGDPFLSC